MKAFRDKYGKDQFSQNGEDGIIKEVLRRLKIKKGVAVEFGGADGFYCSNTAALREKGWTVHMYDIKAVHPYVEEKIIGPVNVNTIPECDVLSIDVDGNDYNIWRAYEGKPKIVIIEVNSDFKPGERVLNKGTSYTPMVELRLSKDYFLLAHTGNMIFVLNEYKDLF